MQETFHILQAEIAPHETDVNPDVSKIILLMGEHGIGKSQLVRQSANAANAAFISRHVGASVFEDNVGLQIVQDGITKHCPAEELAPCFESPKSKSGRGVLLHDEALSGDTGLENQLRELIDGRIGVRRIHPGWVQIAATNPPLSHYSSVRECDIAIASRFNIITIEPTAEEKLMYWRQNNSLPHLLYTFLLLNQSIISDLDSRGWVNLGHSMSKWLNAKIDLNTFVKLLAINVSNSVANLFATYLRLGEDPCAYPIAADRLFKAGPEEHITHVNRVKQWVSKGSDVLVGATCLDIRSYINCTDSFTQNERRKLYDILDIVSDKYADIATNIIVNIKNGELKSTMANELSGRPLGQEILRIIT